MLVTFISSHLDENNSPTCSPAEQVFEIKELALYIINDATMDHPYVNVIPKSLRGIRLLSKACFQWCQLIVEQWQALRLPLGEQFNAIETAGVGDAKAAVQLIIDNQLHVANLSKFKEITDHGLMYLFAHSPHIKHLNISHSKVSTLPAYVNLETLHGDKMYALENFQGPLPMLQVLKIKQMAATFLPSMLNLTTLELTDCFSLETLPPLPKLLRFTCEKNRALGSFASEGYPELRWLKISYCAKLNFLGAALPALIKLIWQADPFDDNSSTIKLPPAMPNLESLECNRVADLPEEAPNLLTLHGCITVLPVTLAHVVELNLQFSTALNFFPPELPHLRKLNLSHTFIGGIAIVAPQLKEFDCSYCSFIQFIQGEFDELEHLHCRENYRLIHLPLSDRKQAHIAIWTCFRSLNPERFFFAKSTLIFPEWY